MLPITVQQADEPSRLDLTLGESFGAAFELARMDTFTTGYARNEILDEFDLMGKILSPEEANELYPMVETKFDRPVSEMAAFHLNEEGMQRRKLQEAISRGPAPLLTSISAGLVAHAMDPVETLAGMATGGALRIAGGAMLARSLNPGVRKVATALQKQDKFGIQAAEGMLGNALVEPAMYAQSKRAQVDYSLEDAFVSVVGGGVAFPAIKSIAGAAGNFIGRLSPEGGRLALDSAITRFKQGKKFDESFITDTFKKLVYAKPEGEPFGIFKDYTFSKVESTDLPNMKLFAASNGAGTLEFGTLKAGRDFGEGFTIIDNPTVANNLAVNKFEDVPSDLFEVSINSTAKIIDADRAPDIDLWQKMKDVKEVKEIPGVTEATPLKEIMEKARDPEAINAILKESGYDGVKAEYIEGDGMPFNQINIFNEAALNIKEAKRYKPFKDYAANMDKSAVQAEARKIEDPKQDLHYREDVNQKVEQAAKEDFSQEAYTADIKEKADAVIDFYSKLDDEAKLDLPEGFAKQMEDIQKLKEIDDSVEEIINDMANCLMGFE